LARSDFDLFHFIIEIVLTGDYFAFVAKHAAPAVSPGIVVPAGKVRT
jgi:hypothetical protein